MAIFINKKYINLGGQLIRYSINRVHCYISDRVLKLKHVAINIPMVKSTWYISLVCHLIFMYKITFAFVRKKDEQKSKAVI